MANLLILYENFADSGIVGGAGSWLTSLPLTNVQDPDIQKVARSSNVATSATNFLIDLGRIQPVGGIVFGPTNLSPGATWRVRGYSDAALTTVSYDSGVQTVQGDIVNWADPNAWLEWEDPGFWLGISEFAQFLELPQFNFHVVPPASVGLATVQYWKFEIFDTANADGHVDIGRVMLGRAFRPSTNYSEDNTLSIEPLTDTEESLGGLRAYWERGLRRSFRCVFPHIDESEIFDDILRIMLRSGISRQVFIVPDSDDESTVNRRSFLATFRQIPALQQLLVGRGASAFDLEEVL